MLEALIAELNLLLYKLDLPFFKFKSYSTIYLLIFICLHLQCVLLKLKEQALSKFHLLIDISKYLLASKINPINDFNLKSLFLNIKII